MNTEDDEFERIEREIKMRAAVPNPIHHTDLGESLEYITGWNDCRATILAEQPAQRPWVGLTDEQRYRIWSSFGVSFVAIEHIEAKLKKKNT